VSAPKLWHKNVKVPDAVGTIHVKAFTASIIACTSAAVAGLENKLGLASIYAWYAAWLATIAPVIAGEMVFI
jgi:hypothetical protein